MPDRLGIPEDRASDRTIFSLMALGEEPLYRILFYMDRASSKNLTI
jgi:hypothetical protein